MKKKNGLDYFNTFNTLKELKRKKNWRQKGEVERGKKRCRDRRISLGNPSSQGEQITQP